MKKDPFSEKEGRQLSKLKRHRKNNEKKRILKLLTQESRHVRMWHGKKGKPFVGGGKGLKA